MFYVEVAVNVPLNQTFTYKCEDDVPENQSFGRRVEVRFGNRKTTAFVVSASKDIPASCSVPIEKIRPITKFIDEQPILTRELYETAQWMSNYYIASIGEVIFSIIPSGKRESGTGGFVFAEDIAFSEKLELSEEQKTAVNGILNNADGTFFHYLYGMTGSGKTEVFLSAAERIMAKEQGVIYLVPEIGLTPQVVESVIKRFGNTAAVIHSELTPSQRLREWKRILSKEARIVVGARSAVFAPVPNLGLIIIDEEHDGSYKSGSSPRYHARQVAMHRCTNLQIPLVMGSATPSVEAYHSMQTGTIKKHVLTKRLAGGSVPEISAVNLSLEHSGDESISPTLFKAMQETLSQKRQVILFLNRRGFTHFFRCSTCGFEMKCKNCSVSMTYHKKENRLRCHYCGYSVSPPHQCPSCGSLDIGYSGFGTEYIENEVKAKFPNASVIRIDTDSLTHKGELKEKIDAFKQGSYDIMLGTQMVAKGLNFPKLQLVGVVLADTTLHLPDFRASERTFSLITQVAGRAGRYFPDGKVIVQSFSPDMPPIDMAVHNNTDAFYENELQQRKVLHFPPYSRLLRLVFRSAVAKAAEQAALGAYQILAQTRTKDVDILGPAECPLEMIAKNYRYQILLRGKAIAPLQKMAANLIWNYSVQQNVYIEVDVDPVNML